MALPSDKLTVSYHQIMAMPIRSRTALASNGLADIMAKALTPGQRAALFPKYYREASLGVTGSTGSLSAGPLGGNSNSPPSGYNPTPSVEKDAAKAGVPLPGQGVTPGSPTSRKPIKVSSNKFFDAISASEGTSDKKAQDHGFDSPYDVPLGYGKLGMPPKPLSQMTLAEVYAFGRTYIDKGSDSSAMGRFQITGTTMKDYMEKAGLTWDDPFDAASQQKLAIEIAKSQGLTAWEGLKAHPDLMQVAYQELSSGNAVVGENLDGAISPGLTAEQVYFNDQGQALVDNKYGETATAMTDPNSVPATDIEYQKMLQDQIVKSDKYGTAGTAAKQGGNDVAIARLNPEYVKRATEVQKALDEAGFNDAHLSSTYRPKEYRTNSSGSNWSDMSLHGFGLATDWGGVPAYGTKEYDKFASIMKSKGFYNPYPDNPKEWNHWQIIPDKKITLDGNPDIVKARDDWAATGYSDDSLKSILDQKVNEKYGFEPITTASTNAEPTVDTASALPTPTSSQYTLNDKELMDFVHSTDEYKNNSNPLKFLGGPKEVLADPSVQKLLADKGVSIENGVATVKDPSNPDFMKFMEDPTTSKILTPIATQSPSGVMPFGTEPPTQQASIQPVSSVGLTLPTSAGGVPTSIPSDTTTPQANPPADPPALPTNMAAGVGPIAPAKQTPSSITEVAVESKMSNSNPYRDYRSGLNYTSV